MLEWRHLCIPVSSFNLANDQYMRIKAGWDHKHVKMLPLNLAGVADGNTTYYRAYTEKRALSEIGWFMHILCS